MKRVARLALPALLLAPTFAFAGETRVPIAIDLSDSLTHAEIESVAKDYGLALTPNSDWSEGNDNLEVGDVEEASRDALLEKLAHDARVEIAEPLSSMEAYFVPNDPLYGERQWHLTKVGAERAWESACGRGVTIAVIDTGVACFDDGPFSRGTDLAGTRCKGGYDFVKKNGRASDDNGHGTHVAGTIAQTTNNGKGAAGLAFCAELMPIKVLAASGSGRTTDVAEGVRYAADHGAQIINLSLGGGTPSRILKKAIDHAIDKGVAVVAAAGNSGGSVGYPAAYPGVVAVSATDRNDRIAWFSSRGSEVAIAAPGVQITQQTVCDGGKNHCEIFGTLNGTSMAAPHVAGAFALLMGLGVTSPDAALREIERAAVSKDDATLYGKGVLDVGAAVSHSISAKLFGRIGVLFGLVLALWRWIKGRRGNMTLGAGAIGGAMFGATGLLPFLHWIPKGVVLERARPVVELLSRPFAEWDLGFDASLHRFLPLASAVPAIALVALLLGVRKLRPVLGGFALGGAAYLAHLGFVADASFVFGTLGLRIFALLNAAALLFVARLTLDDARKTNRA